MKREGHTVGHGLPFGTKRNWDSCTSEWLSEKKLDTKSTEKYPVGIHCFFWTLSFIWPVQWKHSSFGQAKYYSGDIIHPSIHCLLSAQNVEKFLSSKYTSGYPVWQFSELLSSMVFDRWIYLCTYPHTTYIPGTKPTLPELLKFTCPEGKVVSIPVEIATNYKTFGTFLLDDDCGVRVDNITHGYRERAENINTKKIFRSGWMEEASRQRTGKPLWSS